MPWEGYGKRPAPDSEAFEPLPGLPGLPAWLWRKLGRRGRVAAGLALVVAAGAIVASVPGIRSGKRADARRAARSERAARARIAAEQRPRTTRLRGRRA